MRVHKLLPYLTGYPQEKIDYLYNGFTQGFTVGFEGPQCSYTTQNGRKLYKDIDAARRKVQQEVDAGRIAGPYPAPHLPNLRVSPLDIRPKKRPGHYRLIHNLSAPYNGNSINANIPDEVKSVHYTTIAEAIQSIVELGPNCYMSKCDISNAYRIAPLAPSVYNLFGFRLDGFYYNDCCLVMGCSTSPAIFEEISTALNWVAKNKLHIPHMHHILDDFFIAAGTFNECAHQLAVFLKFCDEVGVPMAPEKTLGPSRVLPFMGIDLCSISMQARLPMDKVHRCTAEIKCFLSRKSGTLLQIQSLNGLLNFACSVILPGRCFLRRMFALTAGLKKPHHKKRFNAEVILDLKMWLFFLEHYNGKTFFLQEKLHSTGALNLSSDASFLGFGATCRDQWVQCRWPADWLQKYHINFLEMYALMVSIAFWGPTLKNNVVHFYCDNLPTVEVYQNQSADCPYMMALLRHLVLLCMSFNILLHVRHISGICNKLCDKISRFETTPSLLQEYGMTPCPRSLPSELLPQNYKLHHYKSLAMQFLHQH